jgi:hypothetical protein
MSCTDWSNNRHVISGRLSYCFMFSCSLTCLICCIFNYSEILFKHNFHLNSKAHLNLTNLHLLQWPVPFFKGDENLLCSAMLTPTAGYQV